jgi:hypothetical protein
MSTYPSPASDPGQPLAGALFRRVASTLYRVRDKDSSFNFDSFFNGFKKQEGFSPKQMVMLKGLFLKHEVPYAAGDFKVLLRKDIHKAQLRDMPFSHLEFITEFLSKSQLQWVNEHITRYKLKK